MNKTNHSLEEQNFEEVKEQENAMLDGENACEPVSHSILKESESAVEFIVTQAPLFNLPFIVGGAIATIVAIVITVVLILGGGKHEHSFGTWNIVDEPSCFAEGIEDRVCECGEKETRTIATKRHTYSEWVSESNSLTRSCSACEYEEVKEIEATVDSLESSKDGVKIEITEGNNIPEGTFVVTNIVTKSFDQEEIIEIEENIQTTINSEKTEILAIYDISLDYLGSNFKPNGTVKVVLPKPDESYTAYVVVYIDEYGVATPMPTEIVGEEIVFETTHFSKYGIVGYLPSSHEHLFNEWIVVYEPTCTEKGSEERSCICGKTETRDIYKISHTEEIIPTVESTCTTNGLTEGKKCSVCKEILVSQQELPVASHTYDNEYDECNICGHKRDVECAHTETVVIPGKAATCTATGLTDGAKCKKCGEIITSQTSIPIKPHTEIIDSAVSATCTATGLTEGKH